jgi:hypothetical protein
MAISASRVLGIAANPETNYPSALCFIYAILCRIKYNINVCYPFVKYYSDKSIVFLEFFSVKVKKV